MPATAADVEVPAVGGAETLITISLSGFLADAVVTWLDINIGSRIFMKI